MRKSSRLNEAMDDSVEEITYHQPPPTQQRTAYALEQLTAEVERLFPETTVELGGFDGRGTALDALFLTSTEEEGVELLNLLEHIRADGRVARVVGAIGAVLVQIHSNPRTQDSREPFDLNDLWLILAEENEEAESW